MNEETWNNWEQYESPALQRAAQRWGEAAVINGSQLEQQPVAQEAQQPATQYTQQESQPQQQTVAVHGTGIEYDPADYERKLAYGIEVTGRHIEGMRLVAENQELGESYSQLIRQDSNELKNRAA